MRNVQGQTMGQGKKGIISVSLLTAVCLLGDSMLYVTLPIYYKEAGLASLWEVGLLLSVNRLVRLPLNPLVGLMYRRIRLRTGLWIALFLSVISTFGYSVLKGLAAWLMMRIIWGFAWSLLRIGGMMTVIAITKESSLGEGMGLYNGLYRLGSLFGILAGTFLAVKIGFSETLLWMGWLPLLFIPAMKWIDEDAREHASEMKQKKFWPLDVQQILVLITGFITAFYIQGVIASTLSYLLTSQYPQWISWGVLHVQSTVLAGILLGMRWVWEPFVAVGIGRWSDRKGRSSLFLFSMLAFSMVLGMIPLQLPIGLWLCVGIVLLFLSTILTTLADTWMSAVAKQTSISAMGPLYTLALDLGAALGPLWGYLWLEIDGGVWVVYLSGTVAFMVLAFIWKRRFSTTRPKIGQFSG